MSRSAPLSRLIRDFSLHETFTRDVGWNVVSLAVLGVSGVLLNVIVERSYGPAILGEFFQVAACFIVFSQLTSGGLAFSAVKHAAEFAGDRDELSASLSAAVALCGGLALVVCVAIWLGSGWIGDTLESPGVTVGLRWAVPGLWCIAVNKALLFTVNGVRHMRFFAFAQSLRYVLLLAVVVACGAAGASGHVLPVAFSVSEAVLLAVSWPYAFALAGWVAPWRRPDWLARHLRFGFKAMPSGLMLEANTRIDILLLGYFATDQVTGVYAFSALLVEGLGQIPMAILVNVNPLLTQQYASGARDAITTTVRRVRALSALATLLLGLLLVAVYPGVVSLLFKGPVMRSGWPVVGVLAAGTVIASSYAPFQMLLNQVGRPGQYGQFVLACVTTNVVLNLLAIPSLGMLGAASATALAAALSVIYLKWFAHRAIGVRI